MENENNDLQECKELLVTGVRIALNTGFTVPTVITSMLGITFFLLKEFYKMPDNEAIKFLSNAYVTYPTKDQPRIPLEKM